MIRRIGREGGVGVEEKEKKGEVRQRREGRQETEAEETKVSRSLSLAGMRSWCSGFRTCPVSQFHYLHQTPLSSKA